MHSTRRSSLWGAMKHILVTIFILSMMLQLVLMNTRHQKEVDELQLIIDGQIETMDDLSSKNAELNEEIKQLQKDIEEQKELLRQEKEKQSADIGGSFKSYTNYKCLSRTSKQWQLQTQAYTDKNGLRKIGDAYLVALGSYYGTTLGKKYQVTLVNGNEFQIVMCDLKKDEHTDNNNQATVSDGSILEFYVDTSVLHKGAKISGDISSIQFFSGNIASVEEI